MAGRQGFEPWKDLHPCRFSRPVHSTTLPSAHKVIDANVVCERLINGHIPIRKDKISINVKSLHNSPLKACMKGWELLEILYRKYSGKHKS